VLQRVEMCCSILQYVAVYSGGRLSPLVEAVKDENESLVCCSVLQSVAVRCKACRSVLQCVALCCSVLQHENIATR